MRDSYEETLKTEREQFSSQLSDAKSEIDRVSEENTALEQEKMVLKAELRAQKQINGTAPEDEDFTTRDNFEELETEYRALKALRDSEWKKAKKGIRGRLIWDRFFPQLLELMKKEGQAGVDPSSDILDEAGTTDSKEFSEKEVTAESENISVNEETAETDVDSEKDTHK